MAQNGQVEAYLHWVKERGLRYPVRRSTSSARAPHADGTMAQEIPATAPPEAQLESAPLLAPQPHAVQDPARGYGGMPARLLFTGDLTTGDAAFTGEERSLLDKMIAAMRLGAGEVYVTNALAERPLELGQLPTREQIEAARQHLRTLVATVRPELVVLLGGWTARLVLGERSDFHDVRGRPLPCAALGAPVLATYHPRDLLRFPANKRLAWTDLQLVMEILGLTAAPEKGR